MTSLSDIIRSSFRAPVALSLTALFLISLIVGGYAASNSVDRKLLGAAEIVMGMAHHDLIDMDESTGGDLLEPLPPTPGATPPAVVQVIKRDIVMMRSITAPLAPLVITVGFSNIEMNGMEWRVLRLNDSDASVIVAEPRAKLLPPLALTLGIVVLVYSIFWGAVSLAARHAAKRCSQAVRDDVCSSLSGSDLEGISELLPVRSAVKDHVSKIEALNRRERDFLEHVSHELRTPLSVIRLRSDDHPEDPVLSEACSRMEEIVVMFLALSRGESAPSVDFDVEDVIAEVVGDILVLFPDADLSFECDTRVSIFGSPLLFRLLLTNLLKNSLSKGVSEVQIFLKSDKLIVRDMELPLQEVPTIRGYGIGLKVVALCADSLGGGFRLVNNLCGGVDAEFHFKGLEVTKVQS